MCCALQECCLQECMACYLQEFQPLQVSVKCVNNAECVEMLLKQGADATAKDHAVRVAGHIPAERDCTESRGNIEQQGLFIQ